MLISIFLAIIFIFSAETRLHAYIDPGTGGYLAGGILSLVWGFLALFFTSILYFFRNTFKKWIKPFWDKYKKFLIIVIILIALCTIGLGGYLFYKSLPVFDASLSGAHIYDAKKMYDGYNLYEGRLIDMRGNLVKKWSSIYLGVIDKDGDYYAQKYYEAPVWGRYTWDDKVVWELNMPIHHEILLTPNDTIITFAKEVHEYMGRKVEFDIIVELDKNGKILQRFSLWDNLKQFQAFHRKLELDQPPTFLIPESHRKDKSIWGGNYDYYHLNSLSLLPKNELENFHRAFKPGNWLIAFRHGSMMFILDKDTKEILWRAIYDQVKDNIEGPHAPQMLGNGNIVLFDNGRYRKWSRVIALNPASMKILWEYRDKDFYSLSQGYVQPLPNGNLLIVEAEKGRVIELTPDKRTVWEYYHPDKQNKTNSIDKKKWGTRQEIYRMTRYYKDMIDGIIKKQK